MKFYVVTFLLVLASSAVKTQTYFVPDFESNGCMVQGLAIYHPNPAERDQNEDPIITDTAEGCRDVCKETSGCTRWTWIQKGYRVYGLFSRYYGSHQKNECLLRTGEMFDNMERGYGVISGTRDCPPS